MRTAVLLCMSLVCFAQQPAPAGAPANGENKKARIEGVVLSTTGAPIPRAQLRLTGPAAIQNGNATQGGQYSATSGDDGKFFIDNIDPGNNYNLQATKTGFLTTRMGARPNGSAPPFALSAGQTLSGQVLTMTPQGVVSGHISDSNNEPLQGVQVALMQRRYQRGARTLTNFNTVQTNDQGEFRIASVPPGRYYLQATLRRNDNISGEAGKTAPIPTFYPNAIDAQGAAPIDITAGQDMRGIEIRMRQGRVYTASGKAMDATGAPIANAITIVMPKASSSTQDFITQINTQQQTRPDGTFVLRNLTPGVYQVMIAARNTNEGIRIPSTPSGEFSITDKDVTDLAFRVASGGTINGTLSLEGGDIKPLLPAPPAPNPNQPNTALANTVANIGRLSVNLASSTPNPLGGNSSAQVKQDGTFAIENVGAGVYFVNLNAAPQGLYVKSIRYGGTDITHSPLNISSSGGTLEILLAKNAANVTGTVQSEKGEAQAAVMVTLWTDEPEPGAANNGVRTSQTNNTGTFNFRDLRPGTYYVAAWEDLDSGLAQARDFLKLVTAPTRIELRESATATPQVKMIPVATSKALEEKLP